MDDVRNKFLYYLPVVVLGILLLLLFTPREWYTNFQNLEQVPVGWRGAWISNSYTEESGEYVLIDKKKVTWFTDNGQVIEMPLKAIRIPSGKKIQIEFQYYNPSEHWLVPPPDRWHNYLLVEENLLRVFCPFDDEAHTFTRSQRR